MARVKADFEIAVTLASQCGEIGVLGNCVVIQEGVNPACRITGPIMIEFGCDFFFILLITAVITEEKYVMKPMLFETARSRFKQGMVLLITGRHCAASVPKGKGQKV